MTSCWKSQRAVASGRRRPGCFCRYVSRLPASPNSMAMARCWEVRNTSYTCGTTAAGVAVRQPMHLTGALEGGGGPAGLIGGEWVATTHLHDEGVGQ